MPLSHPLIGELRVILKEEYGANVSEAEAGEIGQNFVRFFGLLANIAYHEEEQLPKRGRGIALPNLSTNNHGN